MMSLLLREGGVTIVRFSRGWIEGCLDLSERNDVPDPLYGRPSRDTMRARILARMEAPRSPVEAHLLALREGRVVGSARAVVTPGCGGAEDKPATLSLIIDPGCRRSGIGSALLERVSGEMRSQGVRSIEIGILDAWEGWRRFLERRGFTPRERSADAVLRHEAAVPELLPETDVEIRPIRLPEERGR